VRLKRVVSYFLLIVFLGGVMLVAGDFALEHSVRLCRGLVIADVPVGGLFGAEAEAKVAAALHDKIGKPVAELRFEDEKWEVPWDTVAGWLDAAALVRQGYDIGRKGNLLERLREQFIANHGGKVMPLGLIVDEEKVRALVAAAAATVDRAAADAAVEESAAGVHVKTDTAGRRTNINSTVGEIIKAISEGRTIPVSMVVQDFPALIRAKDLSGIDSLLASFSTTYDDSDENRSRNIQVSAGKIAGVLVKSGETFSFNDTVGARIPEQGYKLAPTLTSAGMIMDWGGGVCQVSSTFYNAALLADFSVVARSSHYQPPSYVPLGQDATVADGQIDLKMKNVRNHAVYIHSVAESGKVEIRIYGKREKGAPVIRVESVEKAVKVPQTIVLQDPMLQLGHEVLESEGRNGFTVTVERVRLQGQREVGREKISTDEFDGEDRIVRVGTLTAERRITK